MSEARERDPFLYRAIELVLNAFIEAGRWVIYLTVGFAFFTAISAGAAVHQQGNRELGAQLLTFGGYLLFYVAAPVLAAMILALFVLELWRMLWRRAGFFEENGLRPAEVLVYGLLLCAASWQANASLHGRWETLPLRAASLFQLQLPQLACARPAGEPQERVASPALSAEHARAGLFVISQEAPRLRAQLLVGSSPALDSLSSGLTGINLTAPPTAP